jgi:hypothetical protein
MTNLKARAEGTATQVKNGVDHLSRDVAQVVGEKAEQLRDATPDVVVRSARSMRRNRAQWGIALGAAAVAALALVLRHRH